VSPNKRCWLEGDGQGKALRRAQSATVHGKRAGRGGAQAPALWVEDAIEAGDEHVGRYAGTQRLVDPFKYLARRVHREGCGPEHAAGGGHHQGSRHAMAGGVPHDEAKVSVG
jgi:hypothetical protein